VGVDLLSSLPQRFEVLALSVWLLDTHQFTAPFWAQKIANESPMKIDLLPFTIPNFVRMASKPGLRQEGFKESPAFPLADVPAEDLAALCDQFRADVFAKAGKPDPAKK
jgi:hypothetical protein